MQNAREDSSSVVGASVMEYHLETTLPLEGFVRDLAFSPDGTLLALTTTDKKACNLLYQVSDWSLRPAPRFARYRLAFGPENTLLVAGVSVERFKLNSPKLGKSNFSIPGQKKGITTLALSPDGRWLAVHQYQENLELWFVGGSTPVLCASRRVYFIERFFFRADSSGFCFFTQEFTAGAYLNKLHECSLTPEGLAGAMLEGPMPEGLSPMHHVVPTVHGLAAMPEDKNVLVFYDWATWSPRAVPLLELPGRIGTFEFIVSPDSAFLLGNLCIDTGALREWQLVVVSLPSGEIVGTVPKAKVSAGLKAIALGAERIAFVTVDGSKNLHVFRRPTG